LHAFTGDNYLVVKRASGKKGAGWLRARAVTGIFHQTNFFTKKLATTCFAKGVAKVPGCPGVLLA